MKLEQTVCAKELAKRLKELGCKQESLYWWVDFDYEASIDGVLTHFENNNEWHVMNNDMVQWVLSNFEYKLKDTNKYSAFTVAELGKMLPSHFVSWRVQESYYICEQLRSIKNRIDMSLFADSEADARAKMMVYLLENKLMEEDNERCHDCNAILDKQGNCSTEWCKTFRP